MRVVLHLYPHVERVLCGVVTHAEPRAEVAAVCRPVAEGQVFYGVLFLILPEFELALSSV